MRDEYNVNGLLPKHLRIEWIRKYHDMSQIEKLQPLKPFIKLLEREREAVALYLSTNQYGESYLKVLNCGDRGKGTTHFGTGADQNKKQYYPCAFWNRRDTVKHITSDCKEFQKLPISKEGGWFELLKQMNACFVCLGNHPQQKCSKKKPCSLCGGEKHHVLLCKSKKVKTDPKTDFHIHAESVSHATQGAGLALYPIR